MSDPLIEWSAWADETRRRLIAKGNVEAIEDHRMSYYLAGWLDGQRGDTEPLQSMAARLQAKQAAEKQWRPSR